MLTEDYKQISHELNSVLYQQLRIRRLYEKLSRQTKILSLIEILLILAVCANMAIVLVQEFSFSCPDFEKVPEIELLEE